MDIHFIPVRSKHQDALPLIVTHGWPGWAERAYHKLISYRPAEPVHGHRSCGYGDVRQCKEFPP